VSDGGPVRVMVVDDNTVIRTGLRSLLALSDDVVVVGEAANGKEAVETAQRVHPDVVLLDVRMPVVDGVTAAKELVRQSKVLMLTYADDGEVITSALRAGASGYLVHGAFQPEELVRAVVGTAQGAAYLSPEAAGVLVGAVRSELGRLAPDRRRFALSEREAEVMDLISSGRSNVDIASKLFLSEKTVKNHVNRIYVKLGVRTRAEAIALWLGVAPAESTL
jgi:DNA-binding NarL/FixJ family response regulator